METNVRLYLAPFQSITTHTFRRIYCSHFSGIDKCYTPFFSKIDHETRLSERKLKELQLLKHGLPEIVPQILSKDPEEILRFARICERLGFKEVNWNLGCPYPQVADKKRGSGMLAYPELVHSILYSIMPQIPLKFSVKCRLGYESEDEIFKLIPVFNDFPVYELTIHGRIGRQLYGGEANQTILTQILPLLKIPFVQNDDIDSFEKFRQTSDLLPSVHTWMLGRGLLSNPFLPEEIKGGIKAIGDRKARLKNFLEDLYFAYRSDMDNRLSILSLLKEYWDYLESLFTEPQKVRRSIKKVKTFDEYEDAVKAIIQDHPILYRTDQGT